MLKYAAILLFTISFISGCIKTSENIAHTPIAKNIDTSTHHSFCNLQTFTAKVIENTIYLNWTCISNFSNYYFVLEKIADSSITIVNVKKGFESPNNQELLFGFSEKDSVNENIAYRISAIKPLKQGEQIFLYLHNRNMFEHLSSSTITIQNKKALTLQSKTKGQE